MAPLRLGGANPAQLEALQAEPPPASRGPGLLPLGVLLFDEFQAVARGLEHEGRAHEGAEQRAEGEEVVGAERG